MVEIAELDSAPETLEATLSYLARDADKLVTYVAAPGGRVEDEVAHLSDRGHLGARLE